ncbi:MAG: 1-acyl-sn-glycerol-3-phosphate acyltransferase [Rickettsiaceae bacterium]|nr:MAG: 1-acyl-sn-glycerol-3-phosphate acyltransferase [Rickettsiaceae bacterium]
MIWRVRVLSFYTIISIFSVAFFIICCLPLTLIDVKYHIKYSLAKFYSRIFIWAIKFTCRLDYQVDGLELLPSQPSIVLANHQSFWDNFIMQIIIPKHSWIVKRQLFNIPFFGWALKMAETIAVDRNDSLSVKQILKEGQKKIQNGLWLIIFPEATRIKPDQNVRFKPSAVKLATMTEAPMVLMVHDAGVYWPKGFWIKKPGVIKIKIIDVIYSEQVRDLDIRDLTQNIENIVNTAKSNLLSGI